MQYKTVHDMTTADQAQLYAVCSQPFRRLYTPQRRIQATEMRCYCKILHIPYKDHVTNEEVRAKIQQAIGPHEKLLTIVKRRKLQWYGHVSLHQAWPRPACKAQWKGEEDKADRVRGGRQHQGMDRPGVRQIPEGSGEQAKKEETGCEIICGDPTTLTVEG